MLLEGLLLIIELHLLLVGKHFHHLFKLLLMLLLLELLRTEERTQPARGSVSGCIRGVCIMLRDVP